MFEQHPVPQEISSYQFRLVGDMTLKQFFQLAAGAVVGLIIYSLPLPGFIKWPFIIISVIGGAAFAFLPVQDRPLEQWLVAFFRSIYAPTLFVWKKADKKVDYFAPDSQAAPQVSEPIPENTPHDNATKNLEANEKNFLAKISSMFGGAHSPTQSTPPPPAQTTPSNTPNSTVPQNQTPPPAPIPQEEIVVPVNRPKPTPPPPPAPPAQVVPLEPANTTNMPQTLGGTLNVAAQTATFSPEAAPPSPPTLPNLVVGQVMDSNGKIVEGAILEISDQEGRPVRALKTNRAGHFLIVTPLPNGQYRLTAEKGDLIFDPVSFTAKGEIISPIAIKAKNAAPEPEAKRPTWSV